MKIIVQRVTTALVKIQNQVVGKIDHGLLVFLGIHQHDRETEIEYLVKKLVHLRIFEDENHKMNLSVKDIQGSILVVSQFTLYADCRRGNRPDFVQAASSENAKAMYHLFLEKLQQENIPIATGVFAADMQVSLVNDGPVTMILEKNQNHQ